MGKWGEGTVSPSGLLFVTGKPGTARVRYCTKPSSDPSSTPYLSAVRSRANDLISNDIKSIYFIVLQGIDDTPLRR